jgi:hypothetical protein
MKKKKLALLLTGELRTFDNEYVIKSWEKFFSKYEVDIFISCWDHRGQSVYSTENLIPDGINKDEKITIDYVKEIFNTNSVELFDYNEWLNSPKIKKLLEKYTYDKYFIATFAGGFLKEKVCRLFENIDKVYDSVILSRPDSIFMEEPPEYFFDGSEKIWHQRNNLFDIIYSVFITSNKDNIIKICNWYTSELRELSILDIRGPYNKLEHCRILYSYIKMLNIEDDTYNGILFAEPFRSNNDLEEYKVYTSNKSLWFFR